MIWIVIGSMMVLAGIILILVHRHYRPSLEFLLALYIIDTLLVILGIIMIFGTILKGSQWAL